MKPKALVERVKKIEGKREPEARRASEPVVLRPPGQSPITIEPEPRDEDWWRGRPGPTGEEALVAAAEWEMPEE